MWWHTVTDGRGREGKLTNRVGSQYSSHYLGTWCIQHYYPLIRTPRLPAVDWTDAPADLNGLARFGQRQNLVSARVPPRFKRGILQCCPSTNLWCCHHRTAVITFATWRPLCPTSRNHSNDVGRTKKGQSATKPPAIVPTQLNLPACPSTTSTISNECVYVHTYTHTHTHIYIYIRN